MLKPRLEKFYENIVCEDFILLYNFRNITQLPTFEGAHLHSTSRTFVSDKLALLQSFSALFLASGQRPTKTKAHKSIALFSIRQGNILGLKATLRKRAFFHFLDKVLLFVLPRLISDRRKSLRSNDLALRFKKHNTRSRDQVMPTQPKSFIVSSKDTTCFPEISELLVFFNSLTGFSLNGSLSFSRNTQRIGRDRLKAIEMNQRVFITENKNQGNDALGLLKEKYRDAEETNRKVVFQENGKHDVLRTREQLSDPSTLERTNHQKAVFLSAFQYPHLF